MGHTKKDPCNEDVCVIAILINNVPKGEYIQFDQTTASCDVDWEKDRPGDEAANEASCRGDLQITEQQEAIEGLVVEDEAIGDLGEDADPFEEAAG